MKPSGTEWTLSAWDALSALHRAARTISAAREPFRTEIKDRVSRALDKALAKMSSADFADHVAVDSKRAGKWRNGELPPPLWLEPILPPGPRRVLRALLDEIHESLYGAPSEQATCEQLAVAALQALAELGAETNGALLGDLKIDHEEARRIAPVAARAMRLLSPFLESLDTHSAGGNP